MLLYPTTIKFREGQRKNSILSDIEGEGRKLIMPARFSPGKKELKCVPYGTSIISLLNPALLPFSCLKMALASVVLITLAMPASVHTLSG